MTRLALLMLLTNCAALKVGYAQVTWVDGSIPPVSGCVLKSIDADGLPHLECKGLNKLQSDLLWKSEKQRFQESEI